MRKYTLKELEALPTLATGQADNLKIETENRRVWLSRCTVADGEPFNNKVTVEQYINGKWQTVETYQALNSCAECGKPLKENSYSKYCAECIDKHR